MPKLDAPEIPVAARQKRYVTIPEKDIFDMTHPDIQINMTKYGPGTHFVEPDVADTLEDRLRAFNRGNVRLMQPRKDANAEAVVGGSRGQQTTQF